MIFWVKLLKFMILLISQIKKNQKSKICLFRISESVAPIYYTVPRPGDPEHSWVNQHRARLYLGGLLQIRIRFVKQRGHLTAPIPTCETNKHLWFGIKEVFTRNPLLASSYGRTVQYSIFPASHGQFSCETFFPDMYSRLLFTLSCTVIPKNVAQIEIPQSWVNFMYQSVQFSKIVQNNVIFI